MFRHEATLRYRKIPPRPTTQDLRAGGYVLLPRAVEGVLLSLSETTARLFMCLLFRARWRREPLDYLGIRLQRGDLICSARKLAEDLQTSKSAVQRGIRRLVDIGMVRPIAGQSMGHPPGRIAGHQFTALTIVNYDAYGDPAFYSGTLGGTPESRIAGLKECREERRNKREPPNTRTRTRTRNPDIADKFERKAVEEFPGAVERSLQKREEAKRQLDAEKAEAARPPTSDDDRASPAEIREAIKTAIRRSHEPEASTASRGGFLVAVRGGRQS